MYGQGLRLHSKCDKYYFGNALALRGPVASVHQQSAQTRWFLIMKIASGRKRGNDKVDSIPTWKRRHVSEVRFEVRR